MSAEAVAFSPFNTPLETGMRALGILTTAFPKSFDLQRLVILDHLLVHTGDVGGPESLHPRLPMRSAELLVRRGLVERGLLLFISKKLVERIVDRNGISYRASESAEIFLTSLTTRYATLLLERAVWVVGRFGDLPDDSLRATANHLFDKWTNQFQSVHPSP